eukprot:811818-Pyramimonas_sp.AAC.1
MWYTVVVSIAFGKIPSEATKRVKGVPDWAGPPFGRCHWGLRWSSYGTTKGGMRVLAQGPSVEFPGGPRNVRRVCRRGRGGRM